MTAPKNCVLHVCHHEGRKKVGEKKYVGCGTREVQRRPTVVATERGDDGRLPIFVSLLFQLKPLESVHIKRVTLNT